MSPDPPIPIDRESAAIEDAARRLPDGDDPRAHVFLEERRDARIVFDSEGRHDRRVTRTRGLAVAGRRSMHVTDPALDEISDLVAGGVPGRSAGGWNGAEDDEAPLLALPVPQASAQPFAWTARIVEFDQKVWVGTRGGVVRDRRRGRRLSVRAGGLEIEQVLDPNQGTLPAPWDSVVLPPAPTAAPPGGAFTAIFAPGVAGVIAHELFGHALEGDVVLQAPTWVQRVTRTARVPLNVIDDPTRGRASWRVDDEGTPSRAVLLIDQGTPSGLLLDRVSGARLNRSSTGHGRRSSYLEPIRPRMGCTIIENGGDDPAAILRGTSSGVYVRRLTAGHVDPVEGRATFVVSDAALIDRGVIGDRLIPFVITLNGPDVWDTIDAVGNDGALDSCVGSCVRDGQPLAVSVGAPTIRIGLVRAFA